MKIKISKEKPDPICLRVSIGGDDKTGYFLSYKGDENDVKKMMILTLQKFLRDNLSESEIKIIRAKTIAEFIDNIK